MDKITIPDLNGTNYFIWELKMKAALSLKRLAPLILEEKPEDLTRKDEMDWITKNSDAIAYIKLSLADEQALQFAAEDNAKVLWDKIRATYMGEAKDCYYRNKNSPSTSQRNNSSRNGHVLTASHREEKPCDNIWILDSGASCHMAKEPVWFKNISPEVMDIYLADKNSKMMSQGTGNVSAKTVSTKHCNSINLTITDVSYVPQLRCNLLSVTCLMDKGCKIKSGNNCVLIYDKNDKLITKAFKNNGRLEIKLEPMYNSECFISDQSTNNYEIWHNSESNGKAERANRVLLERARSLLYESKLPLKFWAEAINCSTQVSNVTPRNGKEKSH
ncbi:retrovirus-related Pol polyprotein from transposon TNT 1-94 [Trichonephila clavipes]|nr:retrovirus-related Pol polyprotein from transposon TNT 1-94 [Trichonephila clavipes]